MINKIKVSGIRKGTNEKVTGTGINIFENQAFIYDRYASYEVEVNSIVLRCYSEDYEKYNEPVTDENLSYKLQEHLINSTIDFVKEHNLTDIESLYFSADSIQETVDYGQWCPATDSSMTLYGIQDNKRKIITNVM